MQGELEETSKQSLANQDFASSQACVFVHVHVRACAGDWRLNQGLALSYISSLFVKVVCLFVLSLGFLNTGSH